MGDPCKKEDRESANPKSQKGPLKPKKPSGCNLPKAENKDKHAYLLPKKIRPPKAPAGKGALAGALAPSNSSKNPFAPDLNPNATHAEAGFTKAQMTRSCGDPKPHAH